ncbi:MAG: hydroxymethylglutaryl-CoA lyase [Oceanococcus sp.]
MRNFDIEISEVGPRDGLQSISPIMSTAGKKAWIDAEAAAGVPEIEVGSFVPAKILPQLADTAELVAHARTIPGLTVAVLVPNFRGAQDAVAAGAHKITIPLSVSESHSLKNVRRTHEQMYAEVARIAELIQSLPEGQRPVFEGGLSTAFGCTLEGRISHEQVLTAAENLLQAGCSEVGLSDTTGYADPRSVRQLIQGIWDNCGKDKLSGIHLHNTRGQGLACALAAVEAGLTTIDASLGGIGGCPFAPGASGNIVTEDLVFMLEAMGLKTGIDLQALINVRKIVKDNLPDEVELFGFTANAGIPKGFAAR